MKLKKGFIINGRFEIKHSIESFSFCEYYSAKDLSVSKLVNISVYNASKISRDDFDEKGNLNEISFLKLKIPGLPTFIDDGEFTFNLEKYRYISTKFISGESALDKLKRQGPFSEIESVNIIESVIKITQDLHDNDPPILLNGLSLNNIMFDLSSGSERIVLINLINLRKLESKFKFSHIDGVAPYLIANESFNNVFTAKSDQFNIGSLLYQLVEGIYPWYSEKSINLNDTDELDVFLDKRSLGLNFLNVTDDHLKKIITKSLDSNSDIRFNSLKDMVGYLNRNNVLVDHNKKQIKKFKKIGNGFKDIGGMNSLKEFLKTKVLDVLNRPEHFEKYGVTVPNGMLLYGPPGCGKTFISEKFCEEAGYNFNLVKPSDLSSIYVSGGEQVVGKLFSEAENNAPTVICFDEVDAVMPKRTESSHQSISSKVNEFLSQINKCSERGIFVIATTNKPDLIDEAILRTGRLEIQVYVGPPDFEARKSMFKLLLNKRYAEIGIDFNNLSKLTDGLVSSDLDFIVNKSAHTAALKDERISFKIIESIIKDFKPSISKSIINSYEKQHEEFDKRDNESNEIKPIKGFRG
tara:strand:- start:219 stop:1955 length:1737 start_codon:yes stop_codon:yes gene_type:complete